MESWKLATFTYAEGVFKELLPKEDYFSRALYIFDIGSNDLTAENYLNMSRENVSAALTDMLDQYTAAIKVRVRCYWWQFFQKGHALRGPPKPPYDQYYPITLTTRHAPFQMALILIFLPLQLII